MPLPGFSLFSMSYCPSTAFACFDAMENTVAAEPEKSRKLGNLNKSLHRNKWSKPIKIKLPFQTR